MTVRTPACIGATFLRGRFTCPRALILACASLVGSHEVLGHGGRPKDECGGIAGIGIPPLDTARVADGLDHPVFVTHAPGDQSRLFIVEQRGVIRILRIDTFPPSLVATPFLSIDSLVVNAINAFDERGLLGLAFHPDYAANGYFYVNYTNNASDTVVGRYSVSGDPDVANPASAVTILTIDQPQTNNNGGWLAFGPDGNLYIATGDGGNLCDTGAGHTAATGNAQDITINLLGKILRIIPSTTDVGGYSIPPSNPFVGVSGDDEIWAYGLRNPWRNSFDRDTGDLYIADVGQDAREEIDYQPFDATGGKNYGWRCFEGNSCSSISGCPTTPCNCVGTGLIFPIHSYTHADGISVTGGYVYRGPAIPELQGTYFFADFDFNQIWSFTYNGGGIANFANRTAELAPGGGLTIGSIVSFGEDSEGELYIVDRGSATTGEVYKIIAPCPADIVGSDGVVNVLDLLAVISGWGPCEQPCPPYCAADINQTCSVNVLDLLAVIGAWGPCP